jgi:hypothetical protein
MARWKADIGWCVPMLSLAAMLVACTSGTPGDRVESASGGAVANHETNAGVVGDAPQVEREPWTFETIDGQLLSTPHYRVFTTSTRAMMIDRLPGFVEAAMEHYTTSLLPLPKPAKALETYVLGTRPQWERLTQQIMGDDAGPYLMIPRGGFTSRARAILWDIGPRDTFVIVAHEGWHQFTQRTFRDPLPVALEEGLACYMEGYRWTGPSRDRVLFSPWSNWERFMQLREASATGQLASLDKLMRSTPQDLIEHGENSSLIYYAQTWALVHFLLEHQNGQHKDALLRMMNDASQGLLSTRIESSLGGRAANLHRARRRGVDVLSVYTGVPTASLDDAYVAFIRDITRTGAGQFIAVGASPVTQGSAGERK